MFGRLVCSLGVGRCLEWTALNLRDVARGILVYWDNRVMEFVGLEVGVYSISISYLFKN